MAKKYNIVKITTQKLPRVKVTKVRVNLHSGGMEYLSKLYVNCIHTNKIGAKKGRLSSGETSRILNFVCYTNHIKFIVLCNKVASIPFCRDVN